VAPGVASGGLRCRRSRRDRMILPRLSSRGPGVKTMRIALVAENVDRRKGGAETSVGEFAWHIAAAGARVCCLTNGGTPGRDGDVEIRPVGAAAGPRWWRYRRFLANAAAVAARDTFDLVHAIVPCPGADIYQPRGGTIPETMERNLALLEPGMRRMLKKLQQTLSIKLRIMRRAERDLLTGKDKPVVACVSSYVARQVERHYGLHGPKVRVIFNGVDPDPSEESKRLLDRDELRIQWGFDPKAVVFATVAHNFKLKGVDKFLRAGALLCRNGHKAAFVVAGRGNEAPYRRLARRCGIGRDVRFVGAVSDVWAVYHAGDACVLASYYDPCSRVVLEAMSAGLPCVTTRYNGASDVIEDGDNGYVVDSPDDVAGLADRMALLMDDQRRQRLGEAGRRLRDELSMARHAREMMVLYEEVVRQKLQRVQR
jgi:UDP-glucose:(heptosyl)LPS alpha-1,3-glucosyltransferase